MTCAPTDVAPSSLSAAVDRAHCWAVDALAAPGRAALDGIWWLSTHVAAVQRTVHPAVRRALPDGTARVAELRAVAGQALWLAWTLEHAMTGDARVAPDPSLGRRLAAAVASYAEQERALVADLAVALEPARLAQVHARYARAVGRAPTRPHPVAARVPMQALAGRAVAVVDHARDVLDSRHVPRRLRG